MYDPSPMCQMFVRTCSHLFSRIAELVADTSVSPSSPCRELLPSVETVSSCSAVSPFQAGLRGQETPASMPFLGTAYNSNCIMLGLHCGFYLLRGSLQGWSWSCWIFTAGWVLLVPPAPSLSIPDHKFLLWSCVVLRSASRESNLLGCALPRWQTEHSGSERESIFQKPHSSVKFQSQTHWPPTEGSECHSGMSLVVQSLRLGLPTQSMWFDP